MRVRAITRPRPEELHARFLSILPRIGRHGRVSFRQLRCRSWEENAVREMVGLAGEWFQWLAARPGRRNPRAVGREHKCGRGRRATRRG
jgi:hypothetical protein